MHVNSKGIIAEPIKESCLYQGYWDYVLRWYFFHFLFVYLPLCPKYYSKYKGVCVSGGGMWNIEQYKYENATMLHFIFIGFLFKSASHKAKLDILVS